MDRSSLSILPKSGYKWNEALIIWALLTSQLSLKDALSGYNYRNIYNKVCKTLGNFKLVMWLIFKIFNLIDIDFVKRAKIAFYIRHKNSFR